MRKTAGYTPVYNSNTESLYPFEINRFIKSQRVKTPPSAAARNASLIANMLSQSGVLCYNEWRHVFKRPQKDLIVFSSKRITAAADFPILALVWLLSHIPHPQFLVVFFQTRPSGLDLFFLILLQLFRIKWKMYSKKIQNNS